MPEPPLQAWEIEEWLTRLAPTNQARILILQDLIRNAGGDRMSGSDLVICRTTLLDLQAKVKGESLKLAGTSGELSQRAIQRVPKQRWPGSQGIVMLGGDPRRSKPRKSATEAPKASEGPPSWPPPLRSKLVGKHPWRTWNVSAGGRVTSSKPEPETRSILGSNLGERPSSKSTSALDHAAEALDQATGYPVYSQALTQSQAADVPDTVPGVQAKAR